MAAERTESDGSRGQWKLENGQKNHVYIEEYKKKEMKRRERKIHVPKKNERLKSVVHTFRENWCTRKRKHFFTFLSSFSE